MSHDTNNYQDTSGRTVTLIECPNCGEMVPKSAISCDECGKLDPGDTDDRGSSGRAF